MPASRATIGCNINALKVNVICSAPCLPARSQSSSRHSPASHPVWCDSPLVEVPSQENLIGTKRVHNQTVGAPGLQGWNSRGFRAQGAPLPAVASASPFAGHAGAGGARSRAMSMRISANICRDTATSASWNVT